MADEINEVHTSPQRPRNNNAVIIGVIIVLLLLIGGYALSKKGANQQSGNNATSTNQTTTSSNTDTNTTTTDKMMNTATSSAAMMASSTTGTMHATTSTGTMKATSTATTNTTIKSFTVTGKNFLFSPSEIKVNKGDTVKITFQNNDGFHNLIIDEFSAKTPTIQSGQNTTIEFTADKTGTFQYYCGVGNHRAMGMFGNLIVQ